LQTVLSKDHYVTIVSDPITGLKQMKAKGNVNLVVIDTDAFEAEAFEFIEYINSSLLFRVPLIVLTSNKTELIKQKLFELNLNHFFVKPFDPLMLVKTINKNLFTDSLNVATT
jgi:DNA-binding response OmpR family regulator